MSTTDCLIVLGPFFALVTVMTIAFGIVHYLDVKNGVR
jgi:uncharacterized membrane protein YidH (DUF202 family)